MEDEFMDYWYRKYHKNKNRNYFAIKNDVKYDLEVYLHGLCGIFAVELAKQMQEQNIPVEMCIIVNEEGIVHCFLMVASPDEFMDYYIDVRGITSDENEFFGEFADFFDYKQWRQGEDCGEEDILFFYDIAAFMKKLYELIGIKYSCFKKEVEETKDIIEKFREYYTLPNEILNAVREET